jgi:hypothetical protein
MTSTPLDRVPVERISERARAARPGRTLLVVLTGLLFALGWVAFKTLALAWLGVAWTGAAVAEGWMSAREDSRSKRVRRGPARAG